MTNDELERMMNFIIEQQTIGAEQLAQAGTTINALIERQERIAEQQASNIEQLAEADAIINALARRQLELGEQSDDHDERIARFERSYIAISTLLEKHDMQIVALTDGHNKLVERQERIAEQQAVSADQLAQAETIINALAQRQLDVGEKLDDLITTVNRYIASRGNGNSGA